VSLDSAKQSLATYFHHVFWFGDLNYRIEGTVDDVIAKANDMDFASLRLCDQLNRERVWGKTFAGFSESEIAFAPTYKYCRGGGAPRTYTLEVRVPLLVCRTVCCRLLTP
jgi:hypothetical protein